MEGIDFARSAGRDPAVWGTEKIAGNDFAEGADAEPARNGRGWTADAQGICGSTAEGGIFPYRAGTEPKTDS